jgi:hypothetical protein
VKTLTEDEIRANVQAFAAGAVQLAIEVIGADDTPKPPSGDFIDSMADVAIDPDAVLVKLRALIEKLATDPEGSAMIRMAMEASRNGRMEAAIEDAVYGKPAEIEDIN